MGRMITNPELVFDQPGDSLSGPDIAMKPEGFGSLIEQVR